MPGATPQGKLAAGAMPSRASSSSTTTTDRRASILPPEMMNGSANGSSSSYSSTRAMRMGWQVEEPELAVVSLELAARLELEHARDQALLRMKYERVERPLGTGAVRGGVLGKGKLEEGVQLHALAAAAGVREDHAAGGDVPGARERAVGGGRRR